MVILLPKWTLGPRGFNTLNFRAIVFGIVDSQPNEYVPDFFEKPPLIHRKKGNQDPKICILVLVIGIIIY